MEFVKDIIRGMVIGIANAIPGVSGGTMMVSMGIYDKIISAFTGVFRDLKKSIKTLLPYVIGMLLGIVGLSFVIEFLFNNYPLQTALTFIGLILGGLPIIFKKVNGKSINSANIFVFAVFFASIILLQYFGSGKENHVTLVLSAGMTVKMLLVGIIAAATMVIPGVSGSMMLMLLGFYTPIIESITVSVKALASGDWKELWGQILILIPFVIGIVIGIFVISKLIEIILKKKETMAYSGILGLVLASPVVVLMQLTLNSIGFGSIVSSVVTFFVGFFIAFFLGRE